MAERTLRRLVRELVNTPLFPLLFLTEAVKLAALGEPLPLVARMVALAIAATIIWTISDAVDVDVDRDQIVGD